jgi:hypothetical protein
MEKDAHQRGFQMQWNNIAWALLQHVKFVREEKALVTGRAENFTRDRASIYYPGGVSHIRGANTGVGIHRLMEVHNRGQAGF